MAPSREENDQTEKTAQLERLDPRGDLILAVGSHRLLVASRVLVLSSSFFERMLCPDAFAEGRIQPTQTDPPVKTLDDQDPDTFRFVCRVLHYHRVDPPKSVAQFTALADTCNFYGFFDALSFHLQVWLDPSNIPTSEHEDQKKLLWVAFVFRQNATFKGLSRRLAFGLTKAELSSWEVHPMPESLKDDVSKMRASVRIKIERLVENAIDEVREDTKWQEDCPEYKLGTYQSGRFVGDDEDAIFSAALMAAESATTVPPPALFYLQTQVVGDLPDCGTDKDGLWLYSFHTGAGLGDAVLSSNKSYAMQAYLNGSQQLFTYPGNTIGPWPLGIAYLPYSFFSYVTISIAESGPPQEGFFYNETGLHFNQSAGGWIVCDWWHGAPQLFDLVRDEAAGPAFGSIPTSCSKVNLVPVAV
ncbi:hypothetical protein DV737_g5798, partial [Chaetothyriales sp. CBS 132003]